MGEAERGEGLFLQLLGGVRLLAGGRDPDGRDHCPRGRKARALLAYLAVAPSRSAPRERLADLLWTDRGPAQARGSLRQALAEVRRCTPDGDLLDVGRGEVRVGPAVAATDLEAITRAAAERRGPELARLVGGVRGGFADGLEGLSPPFDEWLAAERHQQHERVVAGVLEAARDLLGHAPAAELAATLRGLDQLDPFNEAVARLGMRADHAAGDRASLHRRYRRLEEGLAREFNSRPSERTRALFASLTALEPAPAEAAPPPADPAPAALPASPPAAPPTTPPTIIVAPLGADPRDDEAGLAEICTDDIRVALTRLPDLRVVLLDTAEADRLEAVCAGAVGVYMLSGRLRRMDGEVRVNLRLGNVHSRLVVWSEQMRLDPGALLDAVDRVVERAAGAVLPSIDRDLGQTLAGRGGEGGDAGLAYVQARLLIRQARTAEAAERGCALLERALELDPRHLRAMLLLARMYNTDHWQMVAGHDVAAFRARARLLCDRAAAVEPSSVELAVVRAWCDLRRRDWRLAEAGFRRAAELLPLDPDTTNLCAFGLCHLGDLDAADALMQRAFRLNPFPPTDYHADRAVLMALRGRMDEAEEHFDVSGEQGLQYAAVRLAALRAAGGQAERVAALGDRFVRRFRGAWRGASPPAQADLARWADDTVPLREEAHRRFLQDGVAGLLG